MSGIGGGHRADFSISSKPRVGVAVAFRQHLCPMNVRDGAHFRHVLLGTVNGVIDGQEVSGRKLVQPFDRKGQAFAHLDVGPGHIPLQPHGLGGLQVAMGLVTERNHANGDHFPRLRANQGWNRQSALHN